MSSSSSVSGVARARGDSFVSDRYFWQLELFPSPATPVACSFPLSSSTSLPQLPPHFMNCRMNRLHESLFQFHFSLDRLHPFSTSSISTINVPSFSHLETLIPHVFPSLYSIPSVLLTIPRLSYSIQLSSASCAHQMQKATL